MDLCPKQVGKTKLCYPTSEDEGDGEEGGHGAATLHARKLGHPDVSEALDDESLSYGHVTSA